ncbi:MAG TPA: DUF1080 domain-containing protein [Vicinamibacteria bacterium]|nr:DUF1080 domain-containing protein [Vicinamibacteria bacterium]
MTKVAAVLLYTLAMAFSQEGDPKATEVWAPVPAVVRPGSGAAPPSDAVVLFDGESLAEWRDPKWKLEDGAVTVVAGTGSLVSRREFGDVQLHIEWRTPAKVEGEGQGRGNSGVFLMERYEVQVLDSYENETYVNGQAGSIYKQHVPLVNASRGPGEWQSYDIVFVAPRFRPDGALERPGTFTVFHNGVLIQNHVEVKGTTTNVGEPVYKAHPQKAPLALQDHQNPVSYRNIWVREL